MDGAERYEQARGWFEQALARLEEVLAVPESSFIVRDSVIQRFEFTFEAAWKAMYRWMRARGEDVDEAAADVIPEAFKRRLIVDEQGWGRMRKYRNQTSHTYDERLAVEVAAFVRQEGVRLFRDLRQLLEQRAP